MCRYSHSMNDHLPRERTILDVRGEIGFDGSIVITQGGEVYRVPRSRSQWSGIPEDVRRELERDFSGYFTDQPCKILALGDAGLYPGDTDQERTNMTTHQQHLQEIRSLTIGGLEWSVKATEFLRKHRRTIHLADQVSDVFYDMDELEALLQIEEDTCRYCNGTGLDPYSSKGMPCDCQEDHS